MQKVIIFTSLVLLGFSGLAQSNIEKLAELQKSLDEFQMGIGNGADVEKRKIKDYLDAFEIIKKERDSLRILVGILESEILLSKSKLSKNEAAQRAADKLIEAIPKGYFVVLGSLRKEKEINVLLSDYSAKYPQYKLRTLQNKTHTWYHLCLEEKYTSQTINKQVYQVRKNKNLEKSWGIRLD